MGDDSVTRTQSAVDHALLTHLGCEVGSSQTVTRSSEIVFKAGMCMLTCRRCSTGTSSLQHVRLSISTHLMVQG